MVDISAVTSRRLAKLKTLLPPEDSVKLSQHILDGGSPELWLLDYEKKLQGNRVIKEGI
jgi:hypothetical protein